MEVLEIKGRYNTAKAFASVIEDEAISQIKTVCDMEILKDCKIRIMPDVHAGAGCTIGTTMTIKNAIIPNLVGVDIGCGMQVAMLREKHLDLEKLDAVIREYVPSGLSVHEGRANKYSELKQLYCYRELKDTKRIEKSIGTLGGGNHFIEANKDDAGNIYLVVHTGSRNLGKQVAEYYQRLAVDIVIEGKGEYFEKRERLIAEYKEQGRRKELQSVLKNLKFEFENKNVEIPRELAYLDGENLKKYIHDSKICQDYAEFNRTVIIDTIVNKLGLNVVEKFTTVHNYIDTDSMILRKGAVSAKQGEKLLIPINMRDGSLICIGKGNADFNMSAPHGAGRIMSRSKAREILNLSDYKQSMSGIFTTSVSLNTIDEAPFAYKNISDITENITDTALILKQIKPIYNFKAN